MLIAKLIIYTICTSMIVGIVTQNPLEAKSNCFRSPKEKELAHLQLKAQAVCSSSPSINKCNQIFSLQAPEENTSLEPYMKGTCENVGFANIFPISSPVAYRIASIQRKILESNNRKYINSATDFYHHTQMHKKRVIQLALKLYEKFPEEFGGLDKKMIARVFSNHDNAKVALNLQYKNSAPFYQKLYEYYGRKPPKDLINKLNQADKEFMKKAIAAENLAPVPSDSKATLVSKKKAIANLKKLEKMSDYVDRAMNPVSSEEFGRPMWKESKVSKTASAKKMAKYLEVNYTKFVGHLNYKKLSASEFNKLATKLAVSSSFNKIASSKKAMKEIARRSASSIVSVLKSKAASNISKTAIKVLLVSSLALDAVLLASYSKPTGCSELGHHDWITVDGQCKPAVGLTNQFIKYLNLTDQDKDHELDSGFYMCNVVKDNLKIITTSIFEKISCLKNKAILKFSKNKSLDIEFNSDGNIKKINFNNMNSYISGILNKAPSFIKVSGQKLTSCYRGRRQIRCYNKKPNNSAAEFIKSINYKIHQSIACCRGIRNDFMDGVSCEL